MQLEQGLNHIKTPCYSVTLVHTKLSHEGAKLTSFSAKVQTLDYAHQLWYRSEFSKYVGPDLRHQTFSAGAISFFLLYQELMAQSPEAGLSVLILWAFGGSGAPGIIESAAHGAVEAGDQHSCVTFTADPTPSPLHDIYHRISSGRYNPTGRHQVNDAAGVSVPRRPDMCLMKLSHHISKSVDRTSGPTV
eukprot:4651777-Amphidinium_carterae.1